MDEGTLSTARRDSDRLKEPQHHPLRWEAKGKRQVTRFFLNLICCGFNNDILVMNLRLLLGAQINRFTSSDTKTSCKKLKAEYPTCFLHFTNTENCHRKENLNWFSPIYIQKPYEDYPCPTCPAGNKCHRTLLLDIMVQ